MSQLSIDSFMPDNVGSEDVLFENLPLVGTVEFIDGVIVFMPAFIFVFTGNIFLPPALENYTITIAIFIALLGSLTLIVKPKHKTLYNWIINIRNFKLRETDISKNLKNEDGKPFESYEAVPDDDTRKLTKVTKVYPTRNAIELNDGSIISIIEFSGSNLDMAESEMKLSVVDQYAKSVSSQLEHDIQLYLPKRPVSVESTASVYEDRLNNENINPDSRRDAFMQKYLNDRSNWVRSLGSQSSIREQYVIVSVDDSDVVNQSVGASKSSWEKLPAGELFRDIYVGLTGGGEVQSKQEAKRKKIRELNNRVSETGSALSVGPGNSYNVVETHKSVGLIKEFWEGEKIQSDEMKAMSSSYPLSLGKTDIKDNKEKGDEE